MVDKIEGDKMTLETEHLILREMTETDFGFVHNDKFMQFKLI